MVTKLPCSFDAAGGASVEANNEAVCVLSGVGGADILMAEWTNGVGRPCHYVAVDRASRQIVLSVRYTSKPATVFGPHPDRRCMLVSGDFWRTKAHAPHRAAG